MTNEEIARGNANQWCRCFKCYGFIRDSNIKCDKDKLVTCSDWYDGYRTALMACRDKDQQLKEYLEKKKNLIPTSEMELYDKVVCTEFMEGIINELLNNK